MSIFSLSIIIVNALFGSYAALPIRCKVCNFLSSLMIFKAFVVEKRYFTHCKCDHEFRWVS